MMMWFALCMIGLWLLIWIIVAIGKVENDQESVFETSADLPFVSILISLRNENSNVANLCSSLSELNYPLDKYEVLFGDDGSTDSTLLSLRKHQLSNSQIFHFEEDIVGKKEVLAQLIERSKGDFLLFTDADMQFDPEWIRAMLYQPTGDRPELHLGMTSVKGDSWFAKMQNIDWLINEYVIAKLAQSECYLTAWGNNMMIDKHSLDSVGGYAVIPDSITEDVALMKSVVVNKGKVKVRFCPHAVATTLPMLSWKALLHQRKRWMSALDDENIGLYGVGILKLLYLPMVLYMIWTDFTWVWILFILPMIQVVLFNQVKKVTGGSVSFVYLLVFQLYDFIFYLSTFAFHFLPFKVKWKERTY